MKELNTVSIPLVSQRFQEKTTGAAHVEYGSPRRKGINQQFPGHAKILPEFHIILPDALQIVLP
jgi:hypothetical protein